MLLFCGNGEWVIPIHGQIVIHSFLSYEIKHYYSTTAAHCKWMIELLQNRQPIFSDLSTSFENSDGCAEQYWCATALYLLSMLEHA